MTPSGVASAIVIGLVIGALGRLVVPGRRPIPVWVTILVGLAAAFFGAWLVGLVRHVDGVDWLAVIAQVLLAAIGVSVVVRAYAGRGPGGPPTGLG